MFVTLTSIGNSEDFDTLSGAIISSVAQEKVEYILKGKKIITDLEKTGRVLVKSGAKVKSGLFEGIPVSVLVNVAVKDAVITEKVQVILESAQEQTKKAREHFKNEDEEGKLRCMVCGYTNGNIFPLSLL